MKNSFFIFTFLFSLLLITNFCNAQNDPIIKATTTPTYSASSYELINPIGNISEVKDQDAGGLSNFFNLLIKIAIALAGAIAVVMIIVGGIQYMGTDSVWEKGESVSRMTGAVGGIVLLLCSYLILYTINPDLVNIKIGIKRVEESQWEIPEDIESIGTTNIQSGKFPNGVFCPKTGKSSSVKQIAQSFNGKVTYAIGNQGGKGEAGPNGTVLLDCSGFVTAVLKCAGFDPGTDFTDGGTANLFDSKSEKITSVSGNVVNGKMLKAGDIVGYIASDKNKKYGHVLIFTGSSFIESRGGKAGRTPGGNTIEKNFTAEELFNKDYIKRVRRIP